MAHEYPITTKDKIFTTILIIGVLVFVYGQFTSSEHASFYIEAGKIFIYGGIALFLIDRMIKIIKNK